MNHKYDNPQNGCDVANVKVAVPVTPKPEAPKPGVLGETTPTVLPSTGVESLFGSAAGVGALAYAATHYVQSRRKK